MNVKILNEVIDMDRVPSLGGARHAVTQNIYRKGHWTVLMDNIDIITCLSTS